MKNHLKYFFFLFITIFSLLQIHAQTWERIFGEDDRFEYVMSHTTAYDKGWDLLLQVYSNTFWLTKIDINGSIKWSKYFLEESEGVYISYMVRSISNNQLIISGMSTQMPAGNGDPGLYIINNCGELATCKVWYINGENYGYNILSLPSCDIIWHTRYACTTVQWPFERVQLVKTDVQGNFVWINQIVPPYEYPRISNNDMNSLIRTSDGGFLFGGYGYYPDTANIQFTWLRNMMIKCDSIGNEEWVNVFFKQDDVEDINGEIGGVFEHNGFYYGGATQYLPRQDLVASVPFYIKVEQAGDIVDYNFLFGDTLVFSLPWQFDVMNDTSILAVTRTTPSLSQSIHIGMLVTDTLGNVKQSFDNYEAFPVLGCLSKTEDEKYLVTGGIKANSEYDGYAMKVNSSLEWDTLYSGNFTYDSLCPVPIDSTVTYCHCDITPGIPIIQHSEKEEILNVFPNPAADNVIIEIPEFVNVEVLTVTDLLGRIQWEQSTSSFEKYINIDLSSWQKGFYLISISNSNKILLQGKFFKKTLNK